MTRFEKVRLVVGLLLLADAVVGLAGLRRLERLLPGVNLYRVALVEAAAGLVLLILHFTA